MDKCSERNVTEDGFFLVSFMFSDLALFVVCPVA